jgi:hypothetical protein
LHFFFRLAYCLIICTFRNVFEYVDVLDGGLFYSMHDFYSFSVSAKILPLNITKTATPSLHHSWVVTIWKNSLNSMLCHMTVQLLWATIDIIFNIMKTVILMLIWSCHIFWKLNIIKKNIPELKFIVNITKFKTQNVFSLKYTVCFFFKFTFALNFFHMYSNCYICNIIFIYIHNNSKNLKNLL